MMQPTTAPMRLHVARPIGSFAQKGSCEGLPVERAPVPLVARKRFDAPKNARTATAAFWHEQCVDVVLFWKGKAHQY